jgi:O-acetyl-ADP-ribose deacetylase (regulator of RNase III)
VKVGIPEVEMKSRTNKRTRAVIRELYYITHIKNIPSILGKGILCHNRIDELGVKYERIYNEDIVSRRKWITVPDGRSLWSFANLYFQARNPMLYNVICNKSPSEIAVIGVDKNILDRADIFIATGNAAHSQSEILPASQKAKIIPTIMKEIDKDYWTEADGSKRKIMAECLVPELVPAEYVRSIYFGDYKTKFTVQKSFGSPSHISFMYVPQMFFQPIRSKQITSFLSILEGDMFFSRVQTLTVSVNTVGIMGKGVASRAKYQFSDVYVHYQDLCRSHQLKMGKPVLYKRETSFDLELADEPSTLKNANAETWFLLFPTKRHWRDDADIHGIENGLRWLIENYKKEGIKSLALPALGCGLGRLEWEKVGPLLCRYLSALDIPVCIYLPAEKYTPEELLTPDFLLHQQIRL